MDSPSGLGDSHHLENLMSSEKEDMEYKSVTQWYLERPKKENPRIRRTLIKANGRKKIESHPIKLWRHLLSQNPQELEDYVIRLNNKDPKIERIKNKLDFNHAFIKPEFLDEYQNIYLRNAIPSEKEAAKLVFYLKNYALNYFIGKLSLASPLDWKAKESNWGLALLNKHKDEDPCVFNDKKNKSVKVLKLTIYELNRFMRFLHTKHPDIPPIIFEPLSRAVLKKYHADLEMKDTVRRTKYIPREHWEKLEKNLPQEWGCLVRLSYYYGLRRNEAYGLQLSDLRNDYLAIDRQLEKINISGKKYAPLKSRKTRKVPHWFLEPEKTYTLIQQIQKLTLHQDSISHSFINLCLKLELPRYTLHDLRRSFITNCVNKNLKQEDVRLAVGHVDGATTYKYYVIDSRRFSDEIYEPKGAA